MVDIIFRPQNATCKIYLPVRLVKNASFSHINRRGTRPLEPFSGSDLKRNECNIRKEHGNGLLQHLPVCTININTEARENFPLKYLAPRHKITSERRNMEGNGGKYFTSRQNTDCLLQYRTTILKYCQSSRGTSPRESNGDLHRTKNKFRDH